jgi:butyrate kinase
MRLACNRMSILAINPGSMSAKLAFFDGLTEVGASEVPWVVRADLRGRAVDEETDRYFCEIQRLLTSRQWRPGAVAGRGGFIGLGRQRLTAGVYRVAVVREGRAEVCADIYRAVTEAPELDHASNYGIPLAARVALAFNIPAFTVDPIVVDDLQDLARFSGYAPVERRSLAHVLSVRAMVRKAAAQLGRDFGRGQMVAVHLGGGITVAAVRDGRIVDTNNALLGGGPFSPQRVGSLPMRDLIDLCYGGKFTKQELQVELTKRGGVFSYLGDDDMQRIEARIAQGDARAVAVVHAMAYQVAKEIGAMAIAAGGDLAAVVLSGGLCRCEFFLNSLRPRIAHLAPVLVFPGSLEMEAMAHGVYRVLTGQEEALTYVPKPQA